MTNSIEYADSALLLFATKEEETGYVLNSDILSMQAALYTACQHSDDVKQIVLSVCEIMLADDYEEYEASKVLLEIRNGLPPTDKD